MKYSLMFLYALILKEGYYVENTEQKGEKYEITLSNDERGKRFVITLEPHVKDKVKNVIQMLDTQNVEMLGPKEKIGPITFSLKSPDKGLK